MKKRLLLALAILLLSPAMLWAACTSPAGISGSMNWTGTAYQYCDGTTWTAFSAGSAATNPSPFSFTNVTGQALNAVITSNTITISGLGLVPVLASVSGAGSPQISIGGGAWANSGVIYNGQTIAVRQTSPASILTARTATVSVGSVSSVWSVTTVGVVPGSQNYTTPGTFSFTVPAYNSLTVTVNGAGAGGQGGGASMNYGYYQVDPPGAYGAAGGVSRFNTTLVGNGGNGGTAGTATGGDTNTTGAGANGGSGGTGGCTSYGYGYWCGVNGAVGGKGGKAVKTYTPAMLTGGSSITVNVGTGGIGGDGGCVNYGYSSACGATGGTGANGSVAITWN